MKRPVERYWTVRLQELKAALEDNGFAAFVAEGPAEVRPIVLEIIAQAQARTIGIAGSQTVRETGIFDLLRDSRDVVLIDPFASGIPPEESVERRRRALLADLFVTGTNAVTEQGQLVNLDGRGNRVAALAFGPKHVLVLAGRNKIVPDVEDAFTRIRNYAAPANAMRLGKKTPCVQTGRCEDCASAERICNTWTVTEKSFPKNRVQVILVNGDYGL